MRTCAWELAVSKKQNPKIRDLNELEKLNGESEQRAPHESLVVHAKERELSDRDQARIEHAAAFIDAVQLDQAPHPSSDTARLQKDKTMIETADSIGVPRSGPGFASSPPQSMGRFQIKKLLGQGGFASVYLAHDPTLNRNVAIKILKPTSFFSAEATTRFDREAQAAAVLSHPNIIPVFECGAIGNDRYIVSEYSSGVTLKQWSGQQAAPIALKVAAEMVAVLADAVEHAHQRGIVHRDLKPANILLEMDEASDSKTDALPETIRVTDFGLAKYADSADQLETADGAIVGTPAYMSPEQAQGDQVITHSSDIYSLGVILYELLTGTLPIIGKNHIETLLAICKREPRAPRVLNREVPRDLEAICLKCLSKTPAERYPSAHALSRDLYRWIDGEVVSARRVSRMERARKWSVRNPALASAFVAISAALAFASVQWRFASAETIRADNNLSMTQDLIDQLVGKVAGNPDLPPAMRREFSSSVVKLQEQLLEDAPEDRRVIYQTSKAKRQFARLLGEIGEPQVALEVINESIDLIEPYIDDPEFATLKMAAIRYKAEFLRSLSEIEEAEKAILDAEKSTQQSFYDRANTWFQLGITKSAAGRDEEAVDDFEMALTMYAQMPQNHVTRTDMARIEFHLGGTEMLLNRLDPAKARLQSALATFEKILVNLPHHSPDTSFRYVGRCYLQLGRIARGQLKLDQFSDDEKQELVVEARECFDSAASNFQQLIEINPTINGVWGLLAFVYEKRIALETEQLNVEAAKEWVEDFDQHFAETPKRVREYATIGQVLAEAQIKVIQLMHEKDQPDAADAMLEKTEQLLSELVLEFPEFEKFKSLKTKCSELRMPCRSPINESAGEGSIN